MKIFYLDTSSNFLYTAILENEVVIDEIKEKLEKDLSKYTLSKIKELLVKNNISFDNIEKIIVVNGPGSFTGIRVGLTIAKTLAWAKNIPIIQISSLEAMALSNNIENIDYIVPIIDARRNFVFSTIYDNNNKQFILKEQYINLNTLYAVLDSITGNILFVTNDNIETKYNKINYEPNISRIVKVTKNRLEINPHKIDANYLKLTEAEEKYDN